MLKDTLVEDRELARKIVGSFLNGKTKEGKVIPYNIIGLTTTTFNSARLGMQLEFSILDALSLRYADGYKAGLERCAKHIDIQTKDTDWEDLGDDIRRLSKELDHAR